MTDGVLILIVLIIVVFAKTRPMRRFFPGLFQDSSAGIGKSGERSVSKILRRSFRKTPHHFFDDLLLETDDHITQIDHVVISIKGIFVVETKNFKGWIFGSPQNQTWTQVIYGQKYKHYNPLKQNYKHIRILEKVLGIDRSKFQSVIVFTENCELKTEMPENVIYDSMLRGYIRSFEHAELEENALDALAEKLQQAKLDHTRKNIRRHRQHVGEIINEKRM